MVLLNEQEIMFAQMLSGSSAIIECDTLPTTDIDNKSLYKTPTGLYWYGNGGFNKVLNRNDPNDIVTAAVGSSSNPGFKESVPGLVKLYNDSSGLRLDGSGNLCIAQARDAQDKTGNDLSASIEQKNRSVNRPITPSNLQYALSQFVPLVTFAGSIADEEETDKTAASVGAVKKYGEDTLKKYADDSASSAASAALSSAESKINSKATETLNSAKDYTDNKVKNAGIKLAIKRATIAPNGIWKINPGIFAIIFPWDKATFLLNPETNDDVTLEGGVSLVWSTNPGGSQFDIAVLSLGDIWDISNLVQSHHDTYYINNYCVVKNTITGSLDAGDTGYAYVYYIDFVNG